MRLLPLSLLLAGFLTACGEDHDVRTHRGFVEYQCEFERQELEDASLKPEFRPIYEERVERLCADLQESGSREEAVQIYRDADTNSWYRPEELQLPDEPWSGQ